MCDSADEHDQFVLDYFRGIDRGAVGVTSTKDGCLIALSEALANYIHLLGEHHGVDMFDLIERVRPALTDQKLN
jgi:hypothetical protein